MLKCFRKGVASCAAQMKRNSFKTLECQLVPFDTLTREILYLQETASCHSIFLGIRVQSILR